jgi:hypothetical protein
VQNICWEEASKELSVESKILLGVRRLRREIYKLDKKDNIHIRRRGMKTKSLKRRFKWSRGMMSF